MKKLVIAIVFLLMFASAFPYPSAAEGVEEDIDNSTEDSSNNATDAAKAGTEEEAKKETEEEAKKDEYNELGIKIGTEVYGEDISKLSEDELQYIPEGWRDGVVESEHPEADEEDDSSRFLRSAYPNVNNYIKNLSAAKIQYEYNSSLTKFNYRHGYGAVEGVVAHETANDSSNIFQDIAFMSKNHKNAFVHAYVDDKRVIQVHPLDYGAWGAGHYANQRFVHVELVHANNFDEFARSINNYADYIAKILYDYNLGVSNAENSGKGTLWSHKAVSIHLGGTTHVDPHGYFARYGYNWDQFVSLVTKKHEAMVTNKISNTSRLGKVKSSGAKIYSDPTNQGKSITASSQYTNEVFYIKSESKVNNKKYYLISEKPSSKNGVIGWVEAKDITTYAHKAVDKKAKTFIIKGNGAAYNRAWGGAKNKVYDSDDFAKLQGQAFQVHKTETVGNNTWYRGKLNGETVWIHSDHLVSKKESKTSRLGKVKNAKVNIYSQAGDPSTATKAGSTYTNGVYYIKEQVQLDGNLFYLISTSPSSTKGTIGWVNKKDITTYTHKAVDKKAKTFVIKRKGAAYNRAWGGAKNKVYDSDDFAKLQGQAFQVHKTETIGNNTWYRGKLNGETVWIHSDHLFSKKESKTSRLGKVKNAKVNIYSQAGDPSTAIKAGSTYTNGVYYIKKQVQLGGDLFYLISTSPSSTKGTIGWVNTKDITTHTHKAVDNKTKTLYFKDNGAAYNRAWGGAKNKIYDSNDFVILKGQAFQVHKTEKVGNNTWYRGKVNGKTLWIHSSHLLK